MFEKDPQLAVNEFFAVIRIPRGQLRRLLGESATPTETSQMSFLMTIIAGVALSAAAVAAGLAVRARHSAISIVLVCVGIMSVNGMAWAAFVWKQPTGNELKFPSSDLVQVPCGEYRFSCILETFDATQETNYIQIRLPPSLKATEY